MQEFIKNLKEYVRDEITDEIVKYIDQKMGEIKNEMLVRNKTPNKINENNENEDIDEARRKLQLNKTDKNENIGWLKSWFNKIVINDLFIGCTLIGGYKRKIYEVTVNNGGEFIYNGEKFSSPSSASVRIKGTRTDNGWDSFYVCFDSIEGYQTLSYYRYKYFHDNLRKNDLAMYNLLLPCFECQPRKHKKKIFYMVSDNIISEIHS
ncbi:MAG: hypothetical protein PG981_000869 [Wolbachia endosymbiont of Ctenocephalides orientis wCori]|nr:MAG: hypothetical protein PG981_000869 [Wolbachia endosymbiont of Ctenocephalides orientis wCori]